MILYINKLAIAKKFKITFSLIFLIFLIGLISAASDLGTVQKGKCIELQQSYSNSTYTNFTQIQYPNKTVEPIGKLMTKRGPYYNYTFCNNDLNGDYYVSTCTDVDGFDTCVSYNYIVTSTGDLFNISQGLMMLGQLGIIALFLALGFSFSKEKWKMRSLFFMSSLMMGAITLNSIRILSGSSSNLYSMGNIGLLLGITILAFMFAYMFIYYTLEVFKYFKEKRRMRWEVSQDAN